MALALVARLARLLARQETFIEFEDEDLPEGLDAAVAEDAAALRDELAAEIAGAARGEALREGLRIAILGAPNAGKSSLLNALAGREAAIVSPQAGTTRDVVEARVVIAGVPVLLADTAGLRETADAIEAEGVRRARAQGQAAELVLAVFAADAAPDAETLALLETGALAVSVKTFHWGMTQGRKPMAMEFVPLLYSRSAWFAASFHCALCVACVMCARNFSKEPDSPSSPSSMTKPAVAFFSAPYHFSCEMASAPR